MLTKYQYRPKLILALKVLIVIGIMLFGPWAFFMLMDFIGNPIINAFLGASLIMLICIAGGIGKATGETFGASQARNLFKNLKDKTKIN
jgi:hypothetical protein